MGLGNLSALWNLVICIGKHLGTCTLVQISPQFRESRIGDSTVYHTVILQGFSRFTIIGGVKDEKYYHT